MSTLKFNREETQNEDLMAAALYVDPGDKDEDENEPPQDGMAYLRQVIKERKSVPDTVTAKDVPVIKTKNVVKTDNSNSPNPSSAAAFGRQKAAAPEGLCPGHAWQREQVKQFSEVRAKMGKHAKLTKMTGEQGEVRIPDKKNEALWCHLIAGGEVWSQVMKSRDDEMDTDIPKPKKDVLGEAPKLSFVTALPVYVCEAILEYMISWLEVTGWRSGYGPWFYALLTRLEKPLTPDVGSSLRDLALICSQLRMNIVGEASENKDEDIAALNLFICLVARYFDQGDLVDNDE